MRSGQLGLSDKQVATGLITAGLEIQLVAGLDGFLYSAITATVSPSHLEVKADLVSPLTASVLFDHIWELHFNKTKLSTNITIEPMMNVLCHISYSCRKTWYKYVQFLPPFRQHISVTQEKC